METKYSSISFTDDPGNTDQISKKWGVSHPPHGTPLPIVHIFIGGKQDSMRHFPFLEHHFACLAVYLSYKMILPKCVRRFGYLLWKNILWKVRSWPGTILEIIFPTFLFIILIVLRTQIPPENRALQERAAKALPSAGLIPFMQTAYCDMNNKFSNRPDGLPDFSGSKVDSLYQQLAKVSLFAQCLWLSLYWNNL